MIEGGHQYQWLTAYDRQHMEGHRLDWPGQPSFFKKYSPCNAYSLPLPETFPESSLFSFSENGAPSGLSSATLPTLINWNRQTLASLLLLTSAPTARSSFAEGEVWYRSNASAGALHPLEFYLSFPGADDLPAGIYHYDLLKPGLNRLRHDPALEIFAKACGACKEGDCSSLTLIISGIFFRSAWKYRARAYRYLLLDAGHALENLSLALQALGADFDVVLDFDDSAINQSLGFDDRREVSLVAVRLRSSQVLPDENLMLQKSDPEPNLSASCRVSDREIDYPLLHEIHQASFLSIGRTSDPDRVAPEVYQGISNWQNVSKGGVLPEADLGYVESLRQRRSKRNFIKSKLPLDLEFLYTLLRFLGQELGNSSSPEPVVAFRASGVCGLDDGLYIYDRSAGRFALVESQDRHRAVAAASLDQRWLERAALQFLFFADLETMQEVYGLRCYRYLQIAAGCLGQRLYLGATSLGLGCCAVGAFYDRELAREYSLPQNFDPLYLVAVGPVAGAK